MAELTVTQTTEYLKQVAELETSVYKQTEVRKQAKQDLKMPEVQIRDIVEPTRPIKDNAPDAPKFGGPNGFAIFGAISMMGSSILGASKSTFTLILGVIGCLLVIVGFFVEISKYSNAKKAYYKTLNDIEANYISGLRKYEEDMHNFHNKKIEAEKNYMLEKEHAKNVYLIAEKEIAKLDKPLEETQALLEQIYSADIIFPKYRNMVAMCTMYEYFASGRCTELTGSTGAYNLYESELRQNLIINQLEEVNANLEQVRQNQYILYQGISETNKVLREVSADIGGILSMTRDIAVSSRITAFCLQVTAVNSVAQTYIETREYLSDH